MFAINTNIQCLSSNKTKRNDPREFSNFGNQRDSINASLARQSQIMCMGVLLAGCVCVVLYLMNFPSQSFVTAREIQSADKVCHKSPINRGINFYHAMY